MESAFRLHLKGQFERGLPILFLGAGFSVRAKNILNRDIPTAGQLISSIWNISHPGEQIEEGTTLQDAYEEALLRNRNRLTEFLTSEMTVSPESIPEWYKLFFEVPWARCYTLNIDTIEEGIAQKYHLPRGIEVLSATSPGAMSLTPSDKLQVVHLNGTITDIPDRVTFSGTQYAERLGREDPWYIQLSTEILTRSVVFVGTRLDEPPLWGHLELRRIRGGRGNRELRPRSYLVTAHLPRARQALLAEHNIVWIKMSAEEFANEVLRDLKGSVEFGLEAIQRRVRDELPAERIPDVAEISTNINEATDYLLGEEPVWSDIQAGRAIVRSCDEEIMKVVDGYVCANKNGYVVITGTAGSGKSTSLMRVCLLLASKGVKVGWIDRESGISSYFIRKCMSEEDAPSVLAIDDADIYGRGLAVMMRDLASDHRPICLLLGIRSGKADRYLNPVVLAGICHNEVSLPPLTDSDIGALIDVLERENRIGVLKGKPRAIQEAAFKEQAGRQLLVAMIQATSNKRFEEKATDEFFELGEEAQFAYALLVVAANFGFSLSKDEILLASGDRSNSTLNAIDLLHKRHIIALAATADSRFRCRHRLIGEIVFQELQQRGQLEAPIQGLAVMAAAKVYPALKRNVRSWRILTRIISHEFLHRVLGLEGARNCLGVLEQYLSWDYHYWLQRGSLEVEAGEVSLAENFLNQARSLRPDDYMVENEWAYFLFKKAVDHPGAPSSRLFVAEATEILHELIARRGSEDSYPFHVLGSQGLSWSRRGLSISDERRKYLHDLLRAVEAGHKKHPRSKDLEQLLADIRREYLELAARS